MKKQNILLLFTDQQRFDALRCAGNQEIMTPNLDALAESGVRFDNACTSTPVCIAARMSLIFGHRVSRTRWVENRKLSGPAPQLPSIMTLLHDAGYWNHCIGKTHFYNRHYGLHGYESSEEVLDHYVEDDYLIYLRKNKVPTRFPNGLRDLLYFQPQTSGMPKEHHKTTWVTNRSIEFLRNHARYNRNRPFFLWTSWTAPHPPFAPCEPYDSMYDPEKMGLPAFTERPLSTLPAPTWEHRGRLDGAHQDPDRLRRIRALYYGLVSQMDEGVGQVLDELNALGLAEDTIIIFTSDHGDMLGDHGLSQKNVPYEHSVRIPLIIRWPGRTKAGRVCSDTVGLTDILPTLVHGLGLDYPVECGPLPGESLLSAEGGSLMSGRDGYFIDYGYGQSRWIALRTTKYKYVLWASGGREELYDLEEDPTETHNLVSAEPDLAENLRTRVLAWERLKGFKESFRGDDFIAFPEPDAPGEDPRQVVINDGRWAENLPDDEKNEVESFAEAFTRAISKERSLLPEKLSIKEYKEKGGDLRGTPWEEAWRKA